MAMILACPECNEKIKARDEAAGRKVRCPHCGAAVPVPRATVAADKDDDAPPPRPSREAVRSGDRPARPRGAMRQRDEDDELEDDRPRSRRNRGVATKSKAGLVIALCAGGVLVIGGVVLLIVLLGKSGGPRADRQAEMDMKIIGLAYHQHLDTFAKAPFKLEDLQRVLVDSSALQRLRDGRVVFFWGIHVRQMTDGSPNTILAHDKDAPARGGVVLFGDGSVRTITQEEFQKTAKAGQPGNPPPPDPKGDPGKGDPGKGTKGTPGAEYVSQSGAYSIKIPVNASAPVEKQATGANGATTYALQMDMPDKTTFQVMLARFPPNVLGASPPDVTMNQVRDRFTASLGGKIQSEGAGQLRGHPYRDIHMTVTGNGKGRLRIMLVRDDLYQLIVLGPANSPHQNEATSFFESLVLREVAPKLPPTNDPEPMPKDDPGDNSRDFKKLMAAGKHKQAAELMEKLVERASPALRTRMRADLALAWLKAQDKDKALAAARSAVADPLTSKLKIAKHRWHRALGEVFLGTGQYPQAVEHLQRALDNATNASARSECQKMLDEARAKSGM